VPILWGRATDERLSTVLSDATRADYLYSALGMTRDDAPAGYRVERRSALLGDDAATWGHAVTGLRLWEAHRRAGARVVPADAPILEGMTVLVTLGVPGCTMVAPCRVVYVTDEPDVFGFGYGTLSGHPEEGEESFLVRRVDGKVHFDVVAMSRPATLLTRLGGPIARLVQSRMTERYLQGLAAFVAERGPTFS
jgi:uncharacterized protein (UPF0548 family)